MGKPDLERRAIIAAFADMKQLVRAERQLYQHSQDQVRREAELFVEGLVLYGAAIQLASPAGESITGQAVVRLVQLHRELLWSGWEDIMYGRYAAAMNSLRVVFELSDYVIASSYDAKGARRLLNSKKWDIEAARRVVEASLRPENPEVFDEWMARRRDVYNHDFQQVAHTCGPLMQVATAGTLAHGGSWIAPGLLAQLANLYTELVYEALLAIGYAIRQRLQPSGTWSQKQGEFMVTWNEYRNANPLQPHPEVELGNTQPAIHKRDQDTEESE